MLLSTILLFSSLLLSFLVINKLACSIFWNQGLNFKRKCYQNSNIIVCIASVWTERFFFCNPFLNKVKPVFIWISVLSKYLSTSNNNFTLRIYFQFFYVFMCYSLLNDNPVESPINTICFFGLTLTDNKGWLYY